MKWRRRDGVDGGERDSGRLCYDISLIPPLTDALTASGPDANMEIHSCTLRRVLGCS